MERCAGSCWETGPSCERKKTGEQERTERLFMFHLKLPSAGDPCTTPPGSCVACGHTHIHTQLILYLPVPSQLTGVAFLRSWSHVASVVTCLLVVRRRPRSTTTINCVPELDSVFILHAVSCHSFCRACLFWHGAHSALFINTQTQEVLFIRQRDRDQLEVRGTLAQRGDCFRPLEVWGFVLC